MSDNPMLTVALKHGKLPYISELGLQLLLANYLAVSGCLINHWSIV